MKLINTKFAVVSTAIAAAFIGSASLEAALVTISNLEGHGEDGLLSSLTDGVGFDKPDATDPSTWSNDGTSFTEEWYAAPLVDATNSKIGWLTIDLGSSQTDLDELYIFNGNYSQGGAGRLGSGDINLYYALTPTTAPATPGDYDFSGGGWTSLSSGSVPNSGQLVVDLSSIASAQYIGIEILTTQPNDARTGFDEIAVTAIPEPSAVLLGSLGGLLLLRRRRG